MATLAVFSSTTGSLTVAAPAFSYTCGGTERILIVVTSYSSVNIVSTLSYGGVAMSSIGTAGMYYLKNPTTGANNITMTGTLGNSVYLAIVSYTGYDQTFDPTLYYNYSSGTTSPQSTTVTVAIGGSRVIGGFVSAFNTISGSVYAYSPDTILVANTTSSNRSAITDSGDLPPSSRTLTNSSTSGGTTSIISAAGLVIAPSTPTIYASGGFFSFF